MTKNRSWLINHQLKMKYKSQRTSLKALRLISNSWWAGKLRLRPGPNTRVVKLLTDFPPSPVSYKARELLVRVLNVDTWEKSIQIIHTKHLESPNYQNPSNSVEISLPPRLKIEQMSPDQLSMGTLNLLRKGLEAARASELPLGLAYWATTLTPRSDFLKN